MNNGIRSTAALSGRRLQYSIDWFFADNKYFRVKGQWFCHWGIAVNDFLSLAYCVQATLGAFPSYLSARTGQATLLINLPDYRHAPLTLSHRRLALARLHWEGNQSHSSLWDTLQISTNWAEEEAGWSGGLGDMKRVDLQLILVLKRQTAFLL